MRSCAINIVYIYIWVYLRNSNCTYFNVLTIDNRLTKTMTNDRPDPTSEVAPDRQNSNCQTVTNIWSWAPDGARHQDWLPDWPSVVTGLWLCRGSTLTDIRHEGVRKIFRKTRSPSEQPTASTDLTNSAALLNCRRSTLRAPRHDSPDYSRASRRATPRSSFRHGRPFPEPTSSSINIQRVCVCDTTNQ
jgi:hypothetical protein